MIPLIIFIVLNTISLTLAAIFDGEEREIKFSYSFIRIVIESLLIWRIVESFKS